MIRHLSPARAVPYRSTAILCNAYAASNRSSLACVPPKLPAVPPDRLGCGPQRLRDGTHRLRCTGPDLHGLALFLNIPQGVADSVHPVAGGFPFGLRLFGLPHEFVAICHPANEIALPRGRVLRPSPDRTPFRSALLQEFVRPRTGGCAHRRVRQGAKRFDRLFVEAFRSCDRLASAFADLPLRRKPPQEGQHNAQGEMPDPCQEPVQPSAHPCPASDADRRDDRSEKAGERQPDCQREQHTRHEPPQQGPQLGPGHGLHGQRGPVGQRVRRAQYLQRALSHPTRLVGANPNVVREEHRVQMHRRIRGHDQVAPRPALAQTAAGRVRVEFSDPHRQLSLGTGKGHAAFGRSELSHHPANIGGSHPRGLRARRGSYPSRADGTGFARRRNVAHPVRFLGIGERKDHGLPRGTVARLSIGSPCRVGQESAHRLQNGSHRPHPRRVGPLRFAPHGHAIPHGHVDGLLHRGVAFPRHQVGEPVLAKPLIPLNRPRHRPDACAESHRNQLFPHAVA